jgi:hypothetical protein
MMYTDDLNTDGMGKQTKGMFVPASQLTFPTEKLKSRNKQLAFQLAFETLKS